MFQGINQPQPLGVDEPPCVRRVWQIVDVAQHNESAVWSHSCLDAALAICDSIDLSGVTEDPFARYGSGVCYTRPSAALWLGLVINKAQDGLQLTEEQPLPRPDMLYRTAPDESTALVIGLLEPDTHDKRFRIAVYRLTHD